ncbi:RmlC-like cupin domain-containing protein [Phellopilus nigrolimitatus]|nr:RmlC-like cupin domain-containing protein [Phellopilus nigrolimitatus]
MFATRLLYTLALASTVMPAPVGNSTSSSGSQTATTPDFTSLSSAMSSSSSSSTSAASAAASISTTNSILASPFASGSGSYSGSGSASSSSYAPSSTSDNPNNPVWGQDSQNPNPQPINGNLGATIIAPSDTELDNQNPDFFAPPSTDQGTVGNAKWSFSMSHNRIQKGGWARQQNTDVMPLAKNLASVQMRLQAGSIRELHWHSTAEWAFVLKGCTLVTSVNTNGQVFSDKVCEGDLWYFPPGIPHSLQGTNDDPDGTEFILVFDDGSFSEDSTFLLTDWTAHIPKEVLAKNFGLDISAFNKIPSEQLYIFPSNPPPSNEKSPSSPAGSVPSKFTYQLSQAPAKSLSGGSIKIFDTSVFPAATTIVGALVTVEPGAMRELHWHPTEPEWDYILCGEARMTLFASGANARTFDYRVRYVPPSFGHYIENTGNTTLIYLELFNSDKVEDISLQQWLALTPPELVKAHLGVDDATISHLNKTKQYVVGPSSSKK